MDKDQEKEQTPPPTPQGTTMAEQVSGLPVLESEDDVKEPNTNTERVIEKKPDKEKAMPVEEQPKAYPRGVLSIITRMDHTVTTRDNAAENTQYPYKNTCSGCTWQGIYRDQAAAIISA